jgi:diguanylate cyclase (GGDEF)-like protein
MLATAWYAWMHSNIPGSRQLVVLTGLGALWSLGYVGELLSPTLGRKIFWDSVQMLGGATGSGLLAFSMRFTTPIRKFQRRIWLLLSVEPVTIWVLAQLTSTPFRIQPRILFDAPYPYLYYQFGWASWIDFIYGYAMVLGAVVLLLRSFFLVSGLHRFQAGVMLLGVLIPAAGFLLSISNLMPYFMRDTSWLTFSAFCLALAWGIYHYRLYNIGPAARQILFNELGQGLIVLDEKGRVVDLNRAARRILSASHGETDLSTRDTPSATKEAIGLPVRQVIPGLSYPGPDAAEDDPEREEKVELDLPVEGETRSYEVRIAPIRSIGVVAGWLVSLIDITERVRAEAELLELATKDSLTGLINRRHFFVLAEAELERSQRYHHPLSLIMLDLDHFKRINDRGGHAAGDQALRGTADSIRPVLRGADLLARYGGEEFVILLPETSLPEAQHVAERVRVAVHRSQEGIGGHPLTASLGVACLRPGEQASIDQLLSRADLALYQAKQNGRNRVETEG